jgi:hypothetical protein
MGGGLAAGAPQILLRLAKEIGVERRQDGNLPWEATEPIQDSIEALIGPSRKQTPMQLAGDFNGRPCSSSAASGTCAPSAAGANW